SITHRRGITFDKGARRWEIVDDISGGGRSPHDLKWRLCFHPQIKVMVGKGGPIRGDGFSITVTPPVEVRIEEGWYSKGYGSKEPTQTAVFEKRGQVLPFQVIITIDRFRGSTGSKERSENKRGG
ncbi:MAG: heparinase II/III family protein, partial [Thermodesulfobacteriota bacterium]